MELEQKVCILIPTYNEAKAIARLVEALKPYKLDIIVSDDGSSDRTPVLAEDAGAHVLHNQSRTGKGATLRRGFQYLLQKNYAGVIVMDGDGQHAPEDIPHFLNMIKEHPISLIVGSRLQNSQGMPFVRYITNVAMTFLISLGCGCKVYDSQSGFRYLHSEIIKRIQFKSNSYEIESELLMKTAKQGFPILCVPIKTIYGDETSSINPFVDTFRFITYYLKEIFSPRK